VTIKDGNLFFLASPNGSVPGRANEGYGLYFEDCRFLDRWTVTLNGQRLTNLMSSAALGYAAKHVLTNRSMVSADGTLIPQRSIAVQIERTIEDRTGAGDPVLHEAVTVTNFAGQPVDVEVVITFGAHFEDVFEIRGLVASQEKNVVTRIADGQTVILAHHGADDRWRCTSLNFLRTPSSLSASAAIYRLRLVPDEPTIFSMAIIPAVGETLQTYPREPRTREEIANLRTVMHQSRTEWLGQLTEVVTTNHLFNRVIERSLGDLRVLRSRFEGEEYFAAGLPWFGTLFGRDSIITALQTLAYDPRIAEKTLRLLARLQGTRVDAWKSEEPGKILHELRIGPLARADKIPSPYFGTVDATPLFLILLAEHVAWSGDLTLFRELRANVDAALRWIDVYGDLNGDGFLEYAAESEDGYLVNQGWKDSGDAIVNADGSLAVPPIALVEVQGYVYLAKIRLATVFDALGDPGTASRLRQEAATLKKAFDDRFWLPDKGIFALALQKDERPAAVISSNAGQALWGEIVESGRAPAVAQHLGDPTMFSGWAVRTLAAGERRYDPVGYHRGTVWPHDNSLIAAGLRKYGCDDAALSIFSGVFAATTLFQRYRLPELFAGFPDDEFNAPAHYPVACHPQAWAAGAIPFLLQTSLGLSPDALNRKLYVVRPRLPEWLEEVTLNGLRVGGSTVDLRFTRQNATVDVQVTRKVGDLTVIPTPDAGAAVPMNW